MSTFFRADAIKNVCLTEDTISVILLDGRTITVPLTRYPKLFSATPELKSSMVDLWWRLWYLLGGNKRRLEYRKAHSLPHLGLLRGAPAPRSQFK